MELVHSLTDNQTALVGCAFALTICGTLMSLSSLLGRFLRHDPTQESAEPAAIHLPESAPVHKRVDSEPELRRKSA